MQIRPVDPRDISWQISRPTYRVFFWSARSTPAPSDPELMSYDAEEFEVVGASDVREVLAWAEGKAGERRTYTLYVVVEHGDGWGAVQLAGIDPTAAL